jgi:hypothetical protein
MTANPTHRALFALPPMQISEATALAVPQLPPQHPVTGDKEVDAVIWLRSVIGTGQPALIAKAKDAATRIKTPLKELEKRYSAFLARTNGGHMFATFGAIGFADLDGWEAKSIELAARRQEAHARYGDTLFANTEAETFCEETLAGVKEGRDEWELNKAEVDVRFDAMPGQRPSTLSDCLAELKYWTDLYWLRNAVDRDSGESGVPAQARKDYAFRCLGRILPRSTEEAHQVLQYLIDDNAMGWEESHGILRNLMTQPPACSVPGLPIFDATQLRSLRDELHPSLLPLYPHLLTAVPPPTTRDVIDVLEQLDAISYATGISNTAHFAMDVVSGLMAMIDLGQLQPDEPQPNLVNGGVT